MELNAEQPWEIENDKEILKFRFAYKNTLVWPFIRWNVLHIFVSNALLGIPKTTGRGGNSYRDANSYMLKFMHGLMKNPFFSTRKSIMFMYGCTGNVLDENGVIYNRIFDEFAKIFPNDTYVLDCSDRDIMKKAQTTKHYTYLIDSMINTLVYNTEPDPKDIDMADRFIKYLMNKFSLGIMTSAQVNSIRYIILFYSKKVKYQDIFYHMLFHWVHPKIVFIEDGCYGERNAYLCKVLSEMKIISAEIQHGWIGEQHIAYNYGEYIRTNEEYKKYMPDYYCGMSDYWLEQINAPVKKVSLGNPEFWTKHKKFYKKSKQGEKNRVKKTILWLEFSDDSQNVDVLNQFIKKSTEYEILLRIHPLNKGKHDINYKELLKNFPNFAIDISQTVYEAFVLCDYVVADSTTVIYEALEFGKQVFVYKSKYSCHIGTINVGKVFNDAEELCKLLQENMSQNREINECEREKFFSKQWRKNYKTFIQECIK